MSEFTPPADPTAERAVLGAVLLRPDAYDAASTAGINARSFADPAHVAIWDAFTAAVQADAEPDVVAVSSWLDERKVLQLAGGYNYVSSLQGAVPSITNLDHYVGTVLEMHKRRQVIDAAQAAIHMARENSTATADQLAGAIQAGLDAVAGGDTVRMQTLAEAAEASYNALQTRSEEGKGLRGLTTGFRKLDLMTGGLRRTGLTVLAGETGSGKTALAFNILQNAMTSPDAADGHALVFGYEMSNEQVVDRQLASDARVDGARIRDGNLANDDWGPLLQSVERMQGWGSRVDLYDDGAQTVEDIGAIVRAKNRRKDVRLVVVDHLLLMPNQDAHKDRPDLDIAHRADSLKRLASSTQCAVLALSQLNGNLDSRMSKVPVMGDLYGSRKVKQAASEILMLFRPEMYDGGQPESEGLAQVYVRKARFGEMGVAPLHFAKQFVRFEEGDGR